MEFQYKLNSQCVDEISEKIFRHCIEHKTEKKKAQSYRLNAEEALLRWMDAGLADAEITLRFERRMLTDIIDLTIKGAESNPFEDNSGDFGEYSAHLLENMQILPEYSYKKGENRLTFRLPGKKMGQLTVLGIVLAAALAAGIAGNTFIPQASREFIINAVLTPAQSLFYKMLGFIASPMIFLSVVWGIYGIGDPKTFGNLGKKFVLRDIRETFAACIFTLLTIPLIGPSFGSGNGGENQAEKLINMILDIVPANIAEPFMNGNTLQIIFMAVIFGIALLFLGERGAGVASGVEQINYLIQFQMSLVSRLVPFVVFVVVTKLIWSGTLNAFTKVWTLFVVCIAAQLLIVLTYFIAAAAKFGLKLTDIIKRVLPTFMIALATASSSAAFANTTETCQHKFGVRKDIVNFGLPLGMILNRSVLGSTYLIYAIFFAGLSGIQINMQWIISLLISAILLSIATPPVAGGSAIAISLLFAQAGISAEGLNLALTIDILLDFFLTANQVICVALSLALSANSMGMIEKK